MRTKHSDYIAYFRQISQDMGLSFYTYGLDEFLQHLDVLQYPCLLLQRYSYRFGQADADSKYKIRNAGFMVVDNLPQRDDYAAIDTIFDNTEDIADDILIRINTDANDYLNAPANAIARGFDISTAQGIQIENMADSNYGVFISIDFSSEFF